MAVTCSRMSRNVFGSLMSTPIVNPPQSAILGMHSIQERPAARDGQVVIRPLMYVALTYDHRLIDGAVLEGRHQSGERASKTRFCGGHGRLLNGQETRILLSPRVGVRKGRTD